MKKGETREIDDKAAVTDLLRAKYIEKVAPEGKNAKKK